jgi:hypothetical protein
MKKLNVLAFTKNELLAKLLIIARSFRNIDLANTDEVKEFAKKAIKSNFIYPQKYEEGLIDNLILFLLGEQDNAFTKKIEKL